MTMTMTCALVTALAAGFLSSAFGPMDGQITQSAIAPAPVVPLAALASYAGAWRGTLPALLIPRVRNRIPPPVQAPNLALVGAGA